MGFDEGRIVLDSENGTYFAGQTVNGRLEFDQDNIKTFRGMYVKIKGFCKVHWTTRRSRRVGKRTVHYTVNHDSYEEYMTGKVFLAGGETGETQLQPGHHSFPFQIMIPPTCPSSYEGAHGHVRYQIKVVVDRAFKFDQEKKVVFKVVAPLDLNTQPYCSEPIGFEILNVYCCWCVNAGSTKTLVKMPVGGYCPGQKIPIEVSCKNESSVEVSEITFALKKTTTFHAVAEPGTREDTEVVAEISRGPIAGNTTRNWTVEMDIPIMDVNNLLSCQYIDIDYRIKVSVNTSGCHVDEDDSRPLILGDIPLRGFQDNIFNPINGEIPAQFLTSQTVQGVASAYPPSMVTQPMGYPGGPVPQVSPYPAGPVSYPGANPPYPGANPQFPVANPQFPGAIQYISGTNLPYPGANSPYPGTNSPYLGRNPGYPGANSPYPGGNQPYRAPGAQPYPSPQQGAPYPANSNLNDDPPPYPGNPGVNPYASDSTALLKTGTIGFSGPGNPDKMPSLPAGANVPYPTSPANPFMGASAPEPSTPDDEKKPPINGNENKH